MARRSDSFCAACILLLFARISSGFLRTEYYTYQLDGDEQSACVNSKRPFIELYDTTRRLHDEIGDSGIAPSKTEDITGHLITKRNVEIEKPETSTKPPASTAPTSTSSAPSVNSSQPIPLARVPLNRTVTQNVSLLLQPKEELLGKNLGENGTGIRRISTTQAPILESSAVPLPEATKKPADGRSRMEIPLRSEEYDDSMELPDVDDNNLNQTLRQHNISIVKNDTHIYYNSTFSTIPEEGQHYWVDLDNISSAKTNDLLSNSYRRAATVKLSFDFPFYGHLVRNITIATGGFVYTGDYVHSWLAATQYIAPLMANFDTSISNHSFIRHYDNGTAFTVEWHKVALQDKPEEGEFTFQVTLLNTGDIIFVYKSIPLFIEKIRDDQHPVKVGLSDAFIMDQTIFFVRRKTIYEYDRINFAKEDIKNWTVIYLKPLSTCVRYKKCEDCVTQENSAFQCKWCPATQRCSSGRDRFRQEWLARNCDKDSLSAKPECPAVQSSDNFRDGSSLAGDGVQNHSAGDDPYIYSHQVRDGSGSGDKHVKMGVSGIIAIIFIITLVSGLAAWVFYAYRNPHTTSGQILIRYRPSQWRWRRGEPRYTVATIHM